MQNKKLIRFVESFVLMPIATVSLPLGGLSTAAINIATQAESAPQVVLSQKLNNEADIQGPLNQVLDIQALTRQAKADAIDEYFTGLPLEGHGMGMVLAAEKYGLSEWRLIPAIAMRETTGGKYACNYTYKRTGDIRYTFNVFGWGSCKIKFDSYEAAFDVLAKNLSGNNPLTKNYYYGKTTEGILLAYNPAHIAPNYVPQVKAIMEKIGDKEINLELALK